MNIDPATFVLERQLAWARRHDIPLVGSQGERGRRTYADTLDHNLFKPLSEAARAEYAAGDGGELGRTDGIPGKMQAVHSSSALCCNVFEYWRGRPAVIAKACGLPQSGATIAFEQKLPIDSSQFRYAPNLDAVVRYTSGPFDLIAIESKFSEPFSTRVHAGVKAAYLGASCSDFWRGFPVLKKLAGKMSPDNRAYTYLDAAQLLKHILGLSRNAKKKFQLLYLYYAVPGQAGATHADEVADFIALAKRDGVTVSVLTYQDLIVRLLHAGGDGDAAYSNYVAERYL